MDKEDAESPKQSVRREVRAALRLLPLSQREELSRELVRRLITADRWVPKCGAVALFGGLKNEADLRPLLPWLATRSVPIVIFAVVDGELAPFRINDEADMVIGPMGVWEPDREKCQPVEIAALGSILVPGLAFGLDGTRLGRGKGYYDRLLNHPECSARRIGVGFAMQQMPSVPHGPLDARVHLLVSEEGWRDVRSGVASPLSDEPPADVDNLVR